MSCALRDRQALRPRLVRGDRALASGGKGGHSHEPERENHFIIATALAFAASGAVVGCDDDDLGDDDVVATDYAYEDAYLYDSYYPADVAYAGYYWADAWDYSTFYLLPR